MVEDSHGEYKHMVPAFAGWEPETVGIVGLRLILAREQGDLQLQAMHMRRLSEGGHDVLMEALKRLSFEVWSHLARQHGAELEGRLLAVLHEQLNLT